MANISPGELLVDLGAGDGRIVILAAMLYRARAIGVEIDPLRCFFANLVILLLGLRRKAHVYYGNMFSFDITSANVVVLYLLNSTTQKLKKKLVKELRCDARIVSNTFAISGWSPIAYDDCRRIFLYQIEKM
ncbi:MAG: SAM-dependent methyltransferase [Chloroflexota bacterium]